MAKPPSSPSHSTALLPSEAAMLLPDNISVSIRGGKRIVEGYNNEGEKIVIETTINNVSSNTNNGFRSQSMTICDKLTVEERRDLVHEMYNEEGLTQTEIAKRLGVSQKTISNDLLS
ncbi:sigma factor-like helix-turn-helix DNA-binding protein [Vibrio quintilis]|uniref:HTH cro/C1-type domain-containing protein n=1 Tax=Vibrio quintilis TaxID=1117707 RepID=A0A1M7YTX8_9VIBR|nr:helix-turn-helix domain-containing protein [Vibrio quintilis]SHO56073.1 hypothetical protein VQ7734_01836 [Vibrio quintilis]